MNRIPLLNSNRQTRIRNTVYVGSTVNGKAEGHGVLFHPDGSGYCGEWVNNKRHGHGIETEKMGTKFVYDGQWVNNKKHGNGSCIYNTGNSYVGQWRNDIPEGNGVFLWKRTGMAVSGKWVNGQLEGQAFVREVNGVQYESIFRDGTERSRTPIN